MESNMRYLDFTAMVYPPEKYVQREGGLNDECREFSPSELPNLVEQLNNPSDPLPILCEHETNTHAGFVAAAKITPGNGVLVTMRLDTSTEHGRRAAQKVASGEWAYVSLGHEFVATKDQGNKAQSGQSGYSVSKRAREVSCCALGARNQTAIIEKIDESKWSAHAAIQQHTGIVNSSALVDAKTSPPNESNIGIHCDPERTAKGYSFRNVLIGQVIASSIATQLDMTSVDASQEMPTQVESLPVTEQPAVTEPAVPEQPAMTEPDVTKQSAVAKPAETEQSAVANQSEVDETDNMDIDDRLGKIEATISSAEQHAQEKQELEAKIQALEAAQKKSEEDNRAKIQSLEAAQKKAEEDKLQAQKNADIARKQSLVARVKDMENRMSNLDNNSMAKDLGKTIAVNGSALVNDADINIDTSSNLVTVLEKVTEGYIAASDKQTQLTKQLTDMSSAVGIVPDAQLHAGGAKRKLDQGSELDKATEEGTVNASAHGQHSDAPPHGMSKHTLDYLAGKISYNDLYAACEHKRTEERLGLGNHELRGNVVASMGSIAGGLGGSRTAESNLMTYSQYSRSNQNRLLPHPSKMRADTGGIGLKDMFPGIWDEFMHINNSYEKTGVPLRVRENIARDLNTYEHKRRNNESRLELNDTMPPPPGGVVRERPARVIDN